MNVPELDMNFVDIEDILEQIDYRLRRGEGLLCSPVIGGLIGYQINALELAARICEQYNRTDIATKIRAFYKHNDKSMDEILVTFHEHKKELTKIAKEERERACEKRSY